MRTWQSSGAYPLDPSKPVQEALEERVHDVIYPWPTIERTPVPERADGRLVKSHPLDFPMGQGDFRQARLNSTFSAFDYVQHKFRYVFHQKLETLFLNLCTQSSLGLLIFWLLKFLKYFQTNQNNQQIFYFFLLS